MIRAALLALVLALSGCATCRNHPTACTVVGVIVAGSITATLIANGNHGDSRTRIHTVGPELPPSQDGQR